MVRYPQKLHNESGYLIRRCHQINRALFNEEMAGQDLTPVQCAVLRVIYDTPGIDQRSLSLIVGADEVTMGDVVRRLSARKMLERVTNPDDRRARQLFLTEQGKQAWRDAEDGLARLGKRFNGTLSSEELKTFLRLLRKVIETHDQSQ